MDCAEHLNDGACGAFEQDFTFDEAVQLQRRSVVPESVVEAAQLRGKYGYRMAKRAIDIVASLCAVAFLSWLLLAVAIAVKATSSGPVLFKQQRIGKHKEIFTIYKFRTMRVDTPDLPSHLIDANNWMTPVGPFLRRSSVDELPQLFNIISGKMSFVGPRPALWNQCDLVIERDKFGANDVVPGLTGWAQINGRDELTIEEKSALDGEYVRNRSLLFDLKCLLGTLTKLSGEGVVESNLSEAQERRKLS